MAYIFDFENSIIHVTSPQIIVGIQELINEIRSAEASEEGSQYSKIADASGKEDLGGGVSVGITIELLGQWQLKFWETGSIVKVSGGNLVGGPDGDPIAYTAGVQALLIQSAAGTVTTISTGSGLSADEKEALSRVDTLSQMTNTNVTFLKDIEGGKWTVVNDQMVFFKADNLTEIARFNLYDEDGNATTTNVMSRERV